MFFTNDLKVFRATHDTSNYCGLQKTWTVSESLLFSYTLNSINFIRSKLVKDSRVWFNARLTFSYDIDATAASVRHMMGFILHNCKQFSSRISLCTLYSALVRSGWSMPLWFGICATCFIVILSRTQRFVKFLFLHVEQKYPKKPTVHVLLLDWFECQSLFYRRI